MQLFPRNQRLLKLHYRNNACSGLRPIGPFYSLNHAAFNESCSVLDRSASIIRQKKVNLLEIQLKETRMQASSTIDVTEKISKTTIAQITFWFAVFVWRSNLVFAMLPH